MITVLDVAKARGVRAEPDGSITAGAFELVGLALLGGCEVCHASIAAYNAHPSRTGYWRCTECIDSRLAFDTVEEFERWQERERS